MAYKKPDFIFVMVGCLLYMIVVLPTAYADIYQYEDSIGNIMFTDDISKIPNKNSIKTIETQEVSPTSAVTPQQRVEPKPPLKKTLRRNTNKNPNDNPDSNNLKNGGDYKPDKEGDNGIVGKQERLQPPPLVDMPGSPAPFSVAVDNKIRALMEQSELKKRIGNERLTPSESIYMVLKVIRDVYTKAGYDFDATLRYIAQINKDDNHVIHTPATEYLSYLIVMSKSTDPATDLSQFFDSNTALSVKYLASKMKLR